MENNIYDIIPNFDEYIKEQEEKRKIKGSANFIGGAYIALMALPFILSLMLTNFLKVLGISAEQIDLLLNEPMFSLCTHIFLSVLIFLLPLGIILYGEHLKIYNIISFKKPKKEYFLPLILISIGVTAFANVFANILTSLFNGIGIPVSTPGLDYPKGILGVIMVILAVGVTPAFVEEFAFRGVYMGSLKKYGKGFAVAISSVLFAMMHGNLAQIPFAFIGGIIIGIAVIKTDSIWTGILIHFINNAGSVVLTYIIEAIESTKAQTFITTLYFALSVLAFFVGIYLLKGRIKEIANLDQEKDNYSLTVKAKWFFSAPAVIVSVVITCIECILAIING